ncbi:MULTISPECIES: hypothetical protein [Altibacter]|uniref:hypothetical protein n=1 Tax=Altibacter TaxID=1535231 RepID=UPI00055988F6|nr:MULTISPECIES: hypothetical protein [Altibacter]MCW8980740.1 hypothetical protein [Altibacter sp.]MCW9038501.1 hypothetical protein [Altibacter sp.]
METSSVIIDIILLSIIIVPLAFLVIYTTRGENKAKMRLERLCKEKGIKLSAFEINGDTLLGLDTEGKKLITSHRKDIEKEFQVIDLQELKECRLKTIKLSKHTLDWVGLELLSATIKKDIPFYLEEDEESPSTDSLVCLQRATKWEKMIKPLLKAS